MKKALGITGKIFLGKNSPSIAERFEYHTITLIPLILFTAFGDALRQVAERTSPHGSAPSAFMTWIIGASEITKVAAMIICGDVLAVLILLLILALIFVGKPDEEEPASTK
jgi:hypothetical protein